MFDLPNFNIPVYVFLFVFLAYMLFYVLYSLFNIYHLIRYGIYGFGLYLIVTIFTGGTIILVSGSVFMLMEYDWTHTISFGDAVDYYNEDLFPAL
ncbi:MAG: hypothetical protein WC654_02055 [Patescibacteria group bacterium]